MIQPIQTLLTRLAGAALALAGFAASPTASALTAQTITFGTIASQAYGTTLTVSATASSGLPVSFSSSTTGICTVSGSTVSFVATGTCTIAADQAGNATYAAAPEKKQSFSVTNGTQTITFPAIANTSYGVAPFALNATNSINNPVTFSSSTTSICTVSGTTATIVGVGSCTITAAAGPVTNYNPAQNVAQTFTVSKGNQTITFPAPASMNVGGSMQALTATASSGAPVAYSSQTTSVCQISGASSVQANAAGTCTIAANQNGTSNYNAASQVTQSFTVLGKAQTITFAALANKAYGSAAFGVSATASSSLAVSFSSATTGVCTVSGSTVTLVAGGTCSVVANQAGNSTYAAAAPVTQSFTVTPIAQTISFAALAGQTYGAAPFTVSATASSGLPVSFGTATTGVCTVSGNSVTITGGGTCTINANQAGNASYNAASQVSQSFTVAPAAQTLSFTAPGNSTYGSIVALTASASSGLAVSLSSATTGVCTVSGSNATMVGVGTCTINANQAGNANYSAASQVSHSFTVAQAAQTISFPTIANPAYGSTVPLNATATSGLAVSFGSSTTGVCTVSGSNLSIIGSGTCTVTASQAGNANYTAATPVSQNLTVTQVPQTITFTAPANSTYGASVALNASASSGLPVAFSSATTAVCTVSGSTATMVGVGTCTVNANQAGNGGYTAAPQVSQSFSVSQAAQTISFTAPAATPYGGSAALSASATSGLAISFTSATTGVCTVSGNTATMVGVGTCTINANQAGNTNYAAAAQASQSFTVTQEVQTISFTQPGNSTYNAVVSLTASASSGLAITFSSATTGVCTVSGNSATMIGIGTCTINANQAGNTNYAAATQVSRSLTVAQATQTISFASLGNPAFGTTVPLTVSASSGLTVTLATSTTGVCNLSGSNLNIVGVGTCTVTANQAGNSNYAAATQVSQSTVVSQATQTITFAALAGKTYGATPFTVAPTATSGLAVTVSSSSTSVCTAYANTVTIVGVGTCMLNANQAGNANYIAAPQVSQSFTVIQTPQTITFTTVNNVAYGATATLTATASSGKAVSFTSTTPGTCAVSGNGVTGLAPGTCTVVASEAGSTDTSAATPVSQSFPVVQATQTISFPVPGGAAVGVTINLSATASSGLPVSFTTSTPTVCSVSGNTATGIANGYCYVLANQAGNTNIAAAPQVRDFFSITAPQSTPTVVLTSPTANTTSGKNLVFSATALAPAGGDSIVQVAFYNGPSLLGTVTQSPYTITIPDLDPGTYTFTAQSTEAYLGNVVSSAPVTVTILPEGAGGATTTGTQTLYAIYTDQLDTPRMVADQTGNVVWQWDDTDPYGNNLPNQDPNGTNNKFVFNLRFPGQYADVETGTYYNYFRDYDPSSGRYLESDPIGLYGGQLSTYGYVDGRPIGAADRLGLFVPGPGFLAAAPAIAEESVPLAEGLPLAEGTAGAAAGTSVAVGTGVGIGGFLIGIGIGVSINIGWEAATKNSPGTSLYDTVHPHTAPQDETKPAPAPAPSADGAGAKKPPRDIGQFVKTIPQAYKKVLKCDKFAQSLRNQLIKNGISGKTIQINSGTGKIWSNANRTISTNGYHEAILVDGTVYDNLNPNGIPAADWNADLGLNDPFHGQFMSVNVTDF